jgi:hypothetical protein
LGSGCRDAERARAGARRGMTRTHAAASAGGTRPGLLVSEATARRPDVVADVTTRLTSRGAGWRVAQVIAVRDTVVCVFASAGVQPSPATLQRWLGRERATATRMAGRQFMRSSIQVRQAVLSDTFTVRPASRTFTTGHWSRSRTVSSRRTAGGFGVPGAAGVAALRAAPAIHYAAGTSSPSTDWPGGLPGGIARVEAWDRRPGAATSTNGRAGRTSMAGGL